MDRSRQPVSAQPSADQGASVKRQQQTVCGHSVALVELEVSTLSGSSQRSIQRPKAVARAERCANVFGL
jgi:hypothetical protein